MPQNDFEAYRSYPYPRFYPATASVGVIDKVSPATTTPDEQNAFGLPPYIPEPPTVPPTRPRRRGPNRGGGFVVLALVLLLIFGIGLFAGWEFTSNSSSKTTVTTSSSSVATLEAVREAAIAKVEPSVVELEVTTAQGEDLGSGVIIDSKGDIITNNHVVSGEQSIVVVLSNGSNEQGQLVGAVSADDLAVVRITPFAHMTVAQIADSSTLTVGQEVMAIGNPLGMTETATNGIISALNRRVTESTGVTITRAIQTDAAINPGNSGGALIDLQGQLVGIPTLNAINPESNTAADGLGFAIPSNLVETALQQLLQQ